jgi:hypothetical protein
MPEVLVRAMRAWKAAEVVPLHDTSRSLALADARHVYDVTNLKDVTDAHVLANLETTIFRDGELSQDAKRALLRLGDVTPHGLRDSLGLLFPESQLHGGIPIACRRLRLHDGTGARLDDRHGNEAALTRKDLGHANLLADDPAHHFEATILLLKLDFDVDAGSEIQLAKRVDGLLGRLENVEKTLVRPDLELLPRLLVHVRRAIHGETLELSRERNRTRNATTRTPDCIDDLTHRLIEQPMIVTPKPYADFLVHAIPGFS